MEIAVMKRIIFIVFIIALAVSLAAGAFVGGTWWAKRSSAAHTSAHAATVYTCPMHPDYHSDHPGTCPICGMALEAVRAEGATDGGPATGAPPHGSVRVSPERQQAIGVRVGIVGRAGGTRLLRTTGRVVADENRTYPIVAAVSGWIRNVESVTAGDTVKKDQVLASLFAPDAQFETAQQSYYSGLEMLYRAAAGQAQSSHDSKRALQEIERLADGLRSLGVSNSQVRELARRRELVHDIRVESPADGVVLKRGVTPGLRFDRGFEFYRIGDLSRVWIVADLYDHQVPFIRRGGSARITNTDAGHALSATVSPSEPTFDETTQTLKVRLEAANPRLTLKPGMFVDVEFPVDVPRALVVPADAIVDTGLRKTVFVECGEGSFESRLIETGTRIGDDVEVTKGLTLGERIVISGTFFVDSESRMKAKP
jgi:RND family efflux transporter MFP subunit